MNRAAYSRLLGVARRRTRREDEAYDLLHDALIIAIEAGRADLTLPANIRWLTGVIRNRAVFVARSALRRRAREQGMAPGDPTSPDRIPTQFLDSLPRALRLMAMLALGGHTRAEIRYLLGISDAALRQRIRQLRHRWRAAGHGDVSGLPGLKGAMPFGPMRAALITPLRQARATLGSHDTDGHLFVIRSQNDNARQQVGTNPI